MGNTDSEVLKAVWAHCLECSGGSRKNVQGCEVHGCSLYPWRNVSAALKSAEEALARRQAAGTTGGRGRRAPQGAPLQ